MCRDFVDKQHFLVNTYFGMCIWLLYIYHIDLCKVVSYYNTCEEVRSKILKMQKLGKLSHFFYYFSIYLKLLYIILLQTIQQSVVFLLKMLFIVIIN